MTDRSKLFTRLGRVGIDDDKTVDYAVWNELGDEARFETAWQLVVQAYELQGRDLNELRFQRSVENLQRRQG